MKGLSVDFKGKIIPAKELIFRRILGLAAEVYITIPVIDIDNSYNLDSELKEIAVSIEEHKIFPRLLILEIRGTPFFPIESSDPPTRAWYIKACLKDIFIDYKLGPDLHNKVIVKENLLEVFDELNKSPNFFRINKNLRKELEEIKRKQEKEEENLNIIQHRKNNWEMLEHLIGMYNQLVPPEETITYTETDNGIGGFKGSDEFCELTYLQAKKNNKLLDNLEDALFSGRDVKTDLYFTEYYKHRLLGHLNYARCLSYYVNLYEHFNKKINKENLEKAFKAPCPSFFKEKFVCEIKHLIKYQDATFVDWNCSIITLQNNEQLLDSITPASKQWQGKGTVTDRNTRGPWLKVKLDGFEPQGDTADVYVTTPYSGDGESNTIGFHLTPEKKSEVLVKTGIVCTESIYLDSNLSNHPADNKPHWQFPSLDMNLNDLNIKSDEKISLSSPGVKADFNNRQLNIDEG